MSNAERVRVHIQIERENRRKREEWKNLTTVLTTKPCAKMR